MGVTPNDVVHANCNDDRRSLAYVEVLLQLAGNVSGTCLSDTIVHCPLASA